MAAGGLVVWIAVMVIAFYAVRFTPRNARVHARWLILAGGVITPTVTLAALLIHGLPLMPILREPPPEGGLRIAVSGERWWWRVTYLRDDSEPIELANEIWLPRGERVEFVLTSPDVIHSLWIPNLGGKVDMIPGRTTRLVLEPMRNGIFRGACAEYCGGSHALMKLVVVVVERPEFEQWLARQAQPARDPAHAKAEQGEALFLETGCGACHVVRGIEARGELGPDLTHVGSRRSLAAGTLPNDTASFLRWIGHTQSVKPEVRMPAFAMLPPDELRLMAAYLDGLE